MSQELDALMTMKPPELRVRWRVVYRTPAPIIGPDLLRRGIAYRLQERRQGKGEDYPRFWAFAEEFLPITHTRPKLSGVPVLTFSY